MKANCDTCKHKSTCQGMLKTWKICGGLLGISPDLSYIRNGVMPAHDLAQYDFLK